LFSSISPYTSKYIVVVEFEALQYFRSAVILLPFLSVITDDAKTVLLHARPRAKYRQTTMERWTRLEGLSTELFENIISHSNPREKAALSRASRRLHEKVIPNLYSSWEYHGLDHSFRSLHCFLRAIIENQGLASRVRCLDIREWGDCPRLEDYVEDEFVEDNYYAEDSEDSNSDDASSKVKSEDGSTVSIDLDISDEEYDRDFRIICRAASDVGFDNEWSAHFEEAIRDRNEDALLTLLIAKLPNLHTLYMVIPEEAYSIQNYIGEVSERGTLGVLENLETIYICSALRMHTFTIFCSTEENPG
jgi:hypothetical protein